jgi:hypothetical protein
VFTPSFSAQPPRCSAGLAFSTNPEGRALVEVYPRVFSQSLSFSAEAFKAETEMGLLRGSLIFAWVLNFSEHVLYRRLPIGELGDAAGRPQDISVKDRGPRPANVYDLDAWSQRSVHSRMDVCPSAIIPAFPYRLPDRSQHVSNFGVSPTGSSPEFLSQVNGCCTAISARVSRLTTVRHRRAFLHLPHSCACRLDRRCS